jgi:NAD(P)-dependent dehydrogenase (short-subunit alcohol dehydrogenase family)
MPSVLVTGANRGLGLEFARQYAADGWKVVACCRKPDEAAALNKVDGDVRIEMLDVRNGKQIANLVRRLKGQAIDILINNAGIYGPISGSDTDAWLDVMRVNVIAPFRLAEALADHVARSERKLIVNISSVMGSIAENTGGGSTIYRSSKAALNIVTRNLAIELRGKGVTVVVLSPGWVRTDMGKGAPLEAFKSIGSMRKVLAKLGVKDSGKFFNYAGKLMRW